MEHTKNTSNIEYYQTNYSRSACNIGIVHLGYGAFHRAHQAVYVDDYMQATGDLNWGIAAVNLRKENREEFLQATQNKEGYLLKTTSPACEYHYRLVRPHLKFSDWSDNAEEAESLLELPSVHAITITVTESGYYLDKNGDLNASLFNSNEHGINFSSETIYGYLASALAKRQCTNLPPVTVICCDNIRSNGDTLKKNFLQYLTLTHQNELKTWVETYVKFPNTMVDRITPKATQKLEEEIASLFPQNKLSSIQSESYIQWVIQDSFSSKMPPLDKVGVEMTANVHPYEELKIRVLNGGHTSIAYMGALSGHKTFDEAIKDPALDSFFNAFQENEVLPGLLEELPIDKYEYKQLIAARFANSAIADSLERICMDGYTKFLVFIKPTLSSCLMQGIYPKYGIEIIASWYIFAQQQLEHDNSPSLNSIRYIEPNWNLLKPLLINGQEELFATSQALWGDLPKQYPQFPSGIINSIRKLKLKWPA